MERLQITPRFKHSSTMATACAAAIIFIGFFADVACGQTKPAEDTGAASTTQKWVLTWSDEFNGTGAPDPSKWVVATGGKWANNELQAYTARPENIRQENGALVITAEKGTYTGADGITRDYTSGRMSTATLFTQKYGKFEARIKIPRSQGMWPAFWLLGDDHNSLGWPDCGEIDIMENVGKEPGTVHGSLHGPGYSGNNPLTASYTLPNGQAFADDFHVFTVEWEPNAIRFYVDGNLYETKTPADLPSGTRWVFDHPFYLILNLAVGGSWPGNPDATTVFPQTMLVDYVRVYSR